VSRWAVSLVGLKQRTHNSQIVGSNPTRPTTTPLPISVLRIDTMIAKWASFMQKKQADLYCGSDSVQEIHDCIKKTMSQA
jgi:hypothetical protein